MKIYIRSASEESNVDKFEENLATAIADIDDAMKEYYGSEVDEFYSGVVVQDFDDVTKQLDIMVEMPDDEFSDSNVQIDCDNAVGRLDPDAYFWYNEPGKYTALVRDMSKVKEHPEEDSIVNEQNVEEAAEQIVEMLNSRNLGDWAVEEVSIEDVSESVARVHMSLIDYSSEPNPKMSATSDVFKDDAISDHQFKYDLIDDIYPKLVNSLNM